MTDCCVVQESACGCAGIFSSPIALSLYAEAFDSVGALDMLEGFASKHGPAFYGLPVNQSRCTLTNKPLQVPAHYRFGDDVVVPMRAGQSIQWTVVMG